MFPSVNMTWKNENDVESDPLLADEDKIETAHEAKEEKSGGTSYRDKLKGTMVGFLCVLISGASRVSVQLIERRIPDFELNAMRNTIACVLYLLILAAKGKYPFVPRESFRPLATYTVVTTVHAALLYISMAMLPVTTAQSLQQTFNITVGIFLYALVLKEKITARIVFSSFLCIGGVILVLQPEFIFAKITTSHFNVTSSSWAENFTSATDDDVVYSHLDKESNDLVGLIIATSAGILLAVDILVMKYHNASFVDYMLSIPFFCFLAGTLLSLIVMGIFERPTLPNNWLDVAYILIHGIAFAFNWPLYIYILKHITANVFNIIWSTNTIFMLIAQYTILSSILPGHRNWIEVVGALLVMIGTSFGSIINILMD